MKRTEYDIVVIGGGHAGAEAAWAAANLGARVALVTLDATKIGVMSCNPAIGGLAKGHMVREIDALGGLMGLAADATGIMFKVLNTSRGPAVRGPRAQCDKVAYARTVREMLASRGEIEIFEGAAESFVIEDGGNGERVCRGVVVDRSRRRDASATDEGWIELRAGAVVLTTGTFMRGLMHLGKTKTKGGRAGEAPAEGMSATLRELGFELGRLKTGTPPRLRRSTIDWESLPQQVGDDPPIAFSELTDVSRFPAIEQVDCRVTATNETIHGLIRANLDRAPMYSGDIESAGPRYCPSIEDKVVRFAQRSSHHVFLEPESHESDWVYCNGISTSLPADVQEKIVRMLAGCEGSEIVQHGYAVEYDMVRPHQIQATGETKLLRGLFLAGQINGTSGYEEAAGQGLVAGVNAVRRVRGEDAWVLGRDEAYIGVMMDDLVTKTPVEPYRMFTSRAEHRLLLRADNAADRLTEMGAELGLVCARRMELFGARRAAIAALDHAIDAHRIEGEAIATRVRRPGYAEIDLWRDLAAAGCAALAADSRIAATVLADRQYAGYIARQRAEVKRFAEMENRRIPGSLEYAGVRGLRAEARAALERFRPETVGQASRIEGVNPPDISLLLVAIKRLADGQRDRAA